MNDTIDIQELVERESERVRREIDAVGRLPNHPFTAGERSLVGDDPLLAVISTGLNPTLPQRHFVSFAACGTPPPIVRFLAFGVLDEQDRLIAARRSNERGSFSLDLPEVGTFRLRAVLEVREAIDIQVLERIGDRRAREQLEVAADLLETGDPLRPYVLDALLRHEVASVSLVASRPLQPIPVNSALSADDGIDRSAEQSSEGPCSVDTKQGIFKFREIGEESDYPYSAVLIEVWENPEICIARKLLPLAWANQAYVNSIPLKELVPNANWKPGWKVALAGYDEDLSLCVGLTEVDQCLQSDYVQNRAGVKQALERLRTDVIRRLEEMRDMAQTDE